MQNKIYKRSRLNAIFFLLLFMMGAYPVRAQSEQEKYLAYLKVFKRKISDVDISYKYTFTFFSESNRSDNMGELKGTFYKMGKSYLDSSAQGITMLSGGYFFKACSKERDAYVYNIKTVEKNMGIKNFGDMNKIVDVPDSLLLKKGKFVATDATDGIINLSYSYLGKDSPLQQMDMKIRKADTALLEIKMVVGDKSNYKKRITIYDFNTRFDTRIISTSRYFTISGKHVILLNRFKSYKVNALL